MKTSIHIKARGKARKLYFSSDQHFGVPDRVSSRKREDLFVQWLDRISEDAAAVFLMGDLFDFWFEYGTVVQKGYVRLLGKLAEMTDAGIPVYFFRGNHDIWAFRYLEDEIGLKLFRREEIMEFEGKKFFLAHGDGLGPGDRGYKFLKAVFENKINQALFRWVHPDIATSMGLFWSRRSRYAHEAKEQKKPRLPKDPNLEAIRKQRLPVFAAEKLKEMPDINYFIFGHWHYPVLFPLNESCNYVNLGDWITFFSYAEFDGLEMKLNYFKSNK